MTDEGRKEGRRRSQSAVKKTKKAAAEDHGGDTSRCKSCLQLSARLAPIFTVQCFPLPTFLGVMSWTSSEIRLPGVIIPLTHSRTDGGISALP